MHKYKLSKTGFTLIEVVLVLAIGGLIFLLAFLAFSQVQQNRRDSQRRQDARRILAEATNFAADNQGRYPCHESVAAPYYCHIGLESEVYNDIASWTSFKPYLAGNNLKNPSKNTDYYYVAYAALPSATLSNYFRDNTTAPVYAPGNVIVMAKGGYCTGNVLGVSTTNNSFAVWVKLEKGSFCVESS